ncbi:cytochrome-c peroxidase [Flavobacterium terrigena]|uniref:Cytochrome c peroxidase n=1 Tax=Flavobacterium terrigena TaxID=402734 RepID=A0A1H6VK02_9FLAO|nr:cytochrome c peroxidase [Flavobacterium terrigena]SEJ04928.1 cytochrome c peroxidase [Flavobacterium terrigena]
MNFKLSFPIVFFVIAIWFWNQNGISKSDYSENNFRHIITTQAKTLAKEIDKLNTIAISYQNKCVTVEQLRNQLKKTRLSFKKAECILEYYYPKHIKSYINGPPLNHLDPYPIGEEHNSDTHYYRLTPEEIKKSQPLDYLETDHYRGAPKVVTPVGLQVLDEMIFDDDINADDVLKLTSDLKDNYVILVKTLEMRNYFYDHEIMEATRLELVRIFSMGITGFDTPGSQNAMEEAAVSLEGIQEVLQPLLLKLPIAEQEELKKQFQNAIAYLNKNKDFNRFDRFTFITSHVNPLYKALLQMQVSLQIKSTSEISRETTSWNAYSVSIFAEDFLNPYYYTILKKSEDSEALQELGKQLFYDTSLSDSGKMSCASCHNPDKAFSDGVPKSLSNIEGKNVKRNSPSLVNSVFSDRFFYDLRAQDLEEQAGHVIENHMEFNTNFPELVKKIKNNPDYQQPFEKAFGKKDITRYRLSAALASYVASLRSFNSIFDQYARGELKGIPSQIKQGFNLFMGKAGCATCHFAPTFTGLVPPLFHENESEVLGVLAKPNTFDVDEDLGRIENGFTEDNEEIYRKSFKTMTVRNVKLTAPYFHNGAYNTLNEVVDFYNKGGAAGLGLTYEVPNQTLPPDKLKLSKKEIAALIAFMESLTDNPVSKFKNQ